jgi:hypothetical protein
MMIECVVAYVTEKCLHLVFVLFPVNSAQFGITPDQICNALFFGNLESA